MTRANWTLLAIAAGEGEPLSPVQLQKSLFLLGKRIPNAVGDDFYTFTPYDYGPFSTQIYHDAAALAQQGLVRPVEVAGQRWVQYAITPKGASAAAEVEKAAPARAAAYLRQIIAWAMERSFAEIVRAIYKLYPEYRERSVFRG